MSCCSARLRPGSRLTMICVVEAADAPAGASASMSNAERSGRIPTIRVLGLARAGLEAGRKASNILDSRRMRSPGHIAVGTWSGGRFMHFGEPVEEARLEALLRPGDGIATVITADAYGAGEADALLGRALAGTPREDYCLVGAIGHDFYTGEREGAKGFPRFTD